MPTSWSPCCPAPPSTCASTACPPADSFTCPTVSTLPSGTNPPRRRCPQRIQRRLMQRARRGHLLVAYAGAHGLANALDTMLDAAALSREAPLTWLLVGGGPEKAALQQRVASEGLANVVMLDPVPKAAVPTTARRDGPALPRLAEPAAVPIRHQPEQVDGLHDGRPAGGLCHCGRQRPGRRRRLRPVGAAWRCGGRRRRLARLAALPQSDRRAMGARGRAFVQAHHTYPVLARRFLDAVVAARRS